ncbi:MAG: coiled coil domain-containing protein [Gammaproteobacteria bacterium]|nr:coiled coil domain-containing protein [Gammaproteobacteria bacterium]
MTDKHLYIEKAKARLDQWEADIDRLKAKAEETQADSRIEYQHQLEALRAKRDEARRKLREAQDSSDDAWDDIKSGLDKAWDSIGKAFESARSRFK